MDTLLMTRRMFGRTSIASPVNTWLSGELLYQAINSSDESGTQSVISGKVGGSGRWASSYGLLNLG